MDKQRWFTFGFFTIAVILVSLFVTNSPFLQTTKASYLITDHGEKSIIDFQSKYFDEKTMSKALTEEELLYLTTGFMNKLVQDIDEKYQVIHFNSKKELLDDFESIMSRDLAKQYVDFYYEEKDGILYIVPTETPPWFNEEKDYDMIQISDHQVIVTQINNSAFYGHYEIKLELTFTDQWKITDITVN